MSHAEASPADPPRLTAVVLGSGGGGGVPQWNCACRVCRLAWAGDPRVKPRTQSSLAVSADGARWLLLNASIDVRQQILATPAMQPKGQGRGSPIAAVLLTNTDVDHAAGLLALRERQPFTIFGTRATLDTIGANRVFDVVGHDIVPRRAVRLGEAFEPLPGLDVELFAVPGKVPLWLEEGVVKTDELGEGTVGVAVEAGGRRLVYAPGCAQVTDDLHARIARAHALVFDGTLYADDEMIAAGLGEKTGRRMGHSPVSGPGGTLEALARHAGVRKIFSHINNSNPILIEGSPEKQHVETAGWEVAFDGMELRP
jgi:pyrroloquinoline quinone biosynthesis protein B